MKRFFLKIPTSCHVARLRIVDDRRLEEIALIGIWILEAIEVLVWIFYRISEEWLHPEHRESLVGEPFCVLLCRLTIHTRDTIAEDRFAPEYLLLDGGGRHLSDDGVVINSWKFALYLAENIRK